MPWSDPNQNNNNPWGRRPSGNQTPPDLDEAMRRMQQKMREMFGGKGGDGGNDLSRMLLPIVSGVIFTIWMISGLYIVAADEQAVVLRFGQHVDTKGPGLNWHIPYPFEEIEKLPTTTVQRVEVGFRSLDEGRVRKVPQEALMLTKDENIVEISFIVQYQVRDVAEYLFNIDNGEISVHNAAETAIREVIGRTLIDDVLTDKKAQVEIETQELIQQILDSYKSGISIATVKLQNVQPPEQVIKEFKDVASAREDKERAKNEAQAYANDLLPKARGEAKKMVLDAEAFATEAVERARGEADRFHNLLASYQAAPEVTRKRLYLESMQEVMGKADKVIVDRSVAKQVMPYLPLQRAGKVEVK